MRHHFVMVCYGVAVLRSVVVRVADGLAAVPVMLDVRVLRHFLFHGFALRQMSALGGSIPFGKPSFAEYLGMFMHKTSLGFRNERHLVFQIVLVHAGRVRGVRYADVQAERKDRQRRSELIAIGSRARPRHASDGCVGERGRGDGIASPARGNDLDDVAGAVALHLDGESPGIIRAGRGEELRRGQDRNGCCSGEHGCREAVK